MPANQKSQHGQAFARLPMGCQRHDSTLDAFGSVRMRDKSSRERASRNRAGGSRLA